MVFGLFYVLKSVG